MRSPTIFLAGLAVLAAAATAQEPSRVAATEDMVESASALLATVAGGRGGTETLLGFDKGKNLALELGDEARDRMSVVIAQRATLGTLHEGEIRLADDIPVRRDVA